MRLLLAALALLASTALAQPKPLDCEASTPHRQFFEQQDAKGVWQPWFEGFYRKRD